MMARKEGNISKAAELQHAVIPSLEEDMEVCDKEESASTISSGHQHKMLLDFVSVDDIVTDEYRVLAC